MKRRMSCFEHASYNFSEKSPNFFAFDVRIGGDLSLGQIKAALLKVQKTFPLTRMLVERDSNNNPWLVEARDREIPVKHLHRDGDDHWRSVFQRALTTNLPGTKDPLLCVYYLEDEGDSDLILVCHHAFADGVALFALLRHLLVFLGDPQAAIAPFPHYPPIEDLIPREAYEEVVRSLGEALDADKQRVQSRPDIEPGSNETSFEDYQYEFSTWSFDEAFTEQIIKKAREQRTTVHHALGVAFSRAFYRVVGAAGSSTRCFQSPVSLRSRLASDVSDNYSCYVSFIKTDVDCDEVNDFWDVARGLKERFARQAQRNEVFQTLVWINELRSVDLDRGDQYIRTTARSAEEEGGGGAVDYDFSLSNLGRIECPTSVGEVRIQGFHGPTFSAVNRERVIAFFTMAGRMYFSFVFDSRYFQPDRAREIEELAIRHLEEAVM